MKKGRHRRFEEARKLKQSGPSQRISVSVAVANLSPKRTSMRRSRNATAFASTTMKKKSTTTSRSSLDGRTHVYTP